MRLGGCVRRPALLIALALCGALLAPSAQSAAPAGLSVRGNRIVYAQGHTVVLRGIHRDGTESGPSTSPTPVTAAELGWIGSAHPGSWRAGVVRVPVGSAQWTGSCPKLANQVAAYRSRIDAEVQALTRQGIVALIDLHTSTAGCRAIDRHAMPDAGVTETFWSDAARHYARDPRVAFELYNEPHFVSDTIWLNGTAGPTVQDCDGTVGLNDVPGQMALATCTALAPRYRAVGMQSLYDLVTARAPGHLVVVDAPGYASSVPSLRVKATRGGLVYALHPYTCPTPGGHCDTSALAHANVDLLRAWRAVAAVAPVFVTELGWPTYSTGYGTGYVDGARYYRETFAFLDAQSPPWGWVAFAWDGNTGGGFSLIRQTRTYAPNTTGRPVYDALRAQR